MDGGVPLWVQIVTLVIPAAVAVFSAVWASKSAGRAQNAEHEAARLRDLEARVAQRKYELYQPFVQALGDALTPSRSKAALAGFEGVIADFQTFVTMWGSDEVNRAFFRYRVGANTSPPAPITMRLMADLLLAIRRDVAMPATDLHGINVIGMRISDIAEHRELIEALEMPLDKLYTKYDWEPPLGDLDDWYGEARNAPR